MRPEDFLDGHTIATSVYEKIIACLADFGPIEIRASKSQIAFRRERGFAYLWRPGQYLDRPGAEVVLSIALGRHDQSERFKEVVHPDARHWMHHLELDGPEEVDDEVVDWLREAIEHAN